MYQVKATNNRGYTQEEFFKTYSEAFSYSIECKDSGQYKTVVILKFDAVNNDYFLERIIK